ncbi:hypothetical protein M0R04_09215 [Candidatus Dojkabacteria bacterium]|jgi:hypothetical protein|nr:hypothetical protein [Candidatus Dojkabacteria bacterium]
MSKIKMLDCLYVNEKYLEPSESQAIQKKRGKIVRVAPLESPATDCLSYDVCNKERSLCPCVRYTKDITLRSKLNNVQPFICTCLVEFEMENGKIINKSKPRHCEAKENIIDLQAALSAAEGDIATLKARKKHGQLYVAFDSGGGKTYLSINFPELIEKYKRKNLWENIILCELIEVEDK